MKRFVFIISIALMAIVASCSGGAASKEDANKYSQTAVDSLMSIPDDELTEQHIQELIRQANLAIDDAENAPDIKQWTIDNKREYECLSQIIASLLLNSDSNDNWTEQLRADMESLCDRYIKVAHSYPKD